MFRLLFDREDIVIVIKLYDTKTFRIFNLIAKYCRTFYLMCCMLQPWSQARTKIDIVSEDQADTVITNKLFSDNKGFCKTIWRRLKSIGELHTKGRTITQKFFKPW